MTWDADNTDIDLWVTDPVGERAYYSQPRTRSGGHVSNDFTQGYGPEVYSIRRPLPGTYRVQAHYFGDRRQSLTGPVTVQLEFQTRFGSAGRRTCRGDEAPEDGKQEIEIARSRCSRRYALRAARALRVGRDPHAVGGNRRERFRCGFRRGSPIRFDLCRPYPRIDASRVIASSTAESASHVAPFR